MLTPIDIEGTGTTTAVAEVAAPSENYIVCPDCKKPSDFRGKDLLEVVISEDIICMLCGSVIVSCRPEVKTYSYAASSSCGGRGSCYDFDD